MRLSVPRRGARATLWRMASPCPAALPDVTEPPRLRHRRDAASTARARPRSTRSTASRSASRPGASPPIMGPSGSGKSTLMHLLAGLDRPTTGSVVVDGVELDRRSTTSALTELRRDKVGFIFQSFNLLPVLDARGEHPAAALDRRPQARRGVARPPHRHRRPPRPPRRTARPSCPAASSSASPSRARWPSRPAVVFADEPTGNLDSKSSTEVLELLRRSVDEFGQTVIMVTHDARAAAFADRLLVLADGQIVHDGGSATPEGSSTSSRPRASACARSSLRGLFARKLRLALTALAVALGVDADRRHLRLHRHDQRVLRQDLRRSRTRAPTWRSRRARTSRTTTAPRRRCPASILDAGQAPSPASPPPRARSSTRSRSFDAKGKSLGGSAARRASSAPTRVDPRFRVDRRRGGPPAARAATRSRSTPTTADRKGLQARRHDRRPGRDARKATYTLVGITQIGGRRLVRRRDVVDVQLPEAQRIARHARPLRLDPGRPRSPASRRRSSARSSQRALPPTVDGPHRRSSRRPSSRSDIHDNLGFLTHRAARLRRHLAVRRRVHHLQHVLDHGRAADRASSRCCGRSARRAAQVLRSVLGEGLLLGVLGSAGRPRPGHRLTAVGLRALFKAFGVDLPSNGTRDRDAHDHRLAARRHGRHASSPRSRRRSARRACRRSRRCARACSPARARRRGGWPSSPLPADRRSASRSCATACSARFKSDTSALSLMGGGVGATFLGVALAEPAPRAAARLGHRPPARARCRGHRPPGAREHDAPARAHRGHRRGADDRRRARHVRVDLRRRRQATDRRGGRRQPQGRARRPERRRLLRRSRRERAAGGRRRCRASPASAPVRFSTAKVAGPRQAVA